MHCRVCGGGEQLQGIPTGSMEFPKWECVSWTLYTAIGMQMIFGSVKELGTVLECKGMGVPEISHLK